MMKSKLSPVNLFMIALIGVLVIAATGSTTKIEIGQVIHKGVAPEQPIHVVYAGATTTSHETYKPGVQLSKYALVVYSQESSIVATLHVPGEYWSATNVGDFVPLQVRRAYVRGNVRWVGIDYPLIE